MIILHVSYTCQPGTRDKIIQAAKIVTEPSRKDEGNIYYTQFPSPDNDVDMFVAECWESMEALMKHSKTEHMAAFGAARKPYVVPGSFDMKIYKSEPTSL